MKKVLFVGFKPIQLELARKFIEYRGSTGAIEVVPEQHSSAGVDAYVVNGDDPSVDSRLALHVRVKPGPVLCIGARQALGSTLYMAGAFRPATVDQLQELLGHVGPYVAAAANGVPPKVIPFPSAVDASAAQVLVVDDSEMVRRAMTQKITQYGHRVDVAISGDDAMAMLLNGHYRLVFLDVMMPGVDGFEVCKRIKRSREYKDSAVYLLTSKDGILDKVRGAMSGCDGYLTKPLEGRVLRQVLDKYFDRPSDMVDSDMHSSLLASGSLTATELAVVNGVAAAASTTMAGGVVAAAPIATQATEAREAAKRAVQGFMGLPEAQKTGQHSEFAVTRQSSDSDFKTTFAPTQHMSSSLD